MRIHFWSALFASWLVFHSLVLRDWNSKLSNWRNRLELAAIALSTVILAYWVFNIMLPHLYPYLDPSYKKDLVGESIFVGALYGYLLAATSKIAMSIYYFKNK